MVQVGEFHLFYQSYGNGLKDAICQAWFDDSVYFQRNSANQVSKVRIGWKENGPYVISDQDPAQDTSTTPR